jgi:hypothetical protein
VNSTITYFNIYNLFLYLFTETDEIKEKKQSGRVRWSENEKKIVTEYFKNHIRKKITPKKHECDQLLAKHGDVFLHKDWVRIKTFVYNVFREK